MAHNPIPTFVEADDPITLSAEQETAWNNAEAGVNAMWASTDRRYGRSIVPADSGIDTLHLVAWRGERVSAQLLLWTTSDTEDVGCRVEPFRAEGVSLPATIAQARFVRYTLTGASLAADMLDNIHSMDISAKSVRPVWLTIAVPVDAVAGNYSSNVVIAIGGNDSIRLPLTLEVQQYTLSTPDQWSYHLDLWQHPTAVARTEGLELWSDAHFEALRRNMTLLANAGQKVVTATLNKDPWNHQCYDGYAPMIRWTLHSDGRWSYNYDIFDRWVEMMFSLGIDKMINCYSMVPWNCEIEYYDEATHEVVTIKAEPSKPIFSEVWRHFLVDFKEHLHTKGWLDITNIAMDERAPEEMDAAVKVLAECAPEMGFAIADMHKSYRRYMNMRDVCVAQEQPADHDDILSRREQGYSTTFYICCNPSYPNTFTISEPYEAELLGWYGLAHDYDGMLRWAYNSWPENPAYDSRYGNWSPGDTFLIYPHARSSIRFERLIDGIEVAEKVRTLRNMGIDTNKVESILAKIRSTNINDPNEPWREIVAEAREALNTISK
ncbi:MAG: DUF4091 domain-containing protein [Alistipes sp.]|nr:DUF4091 domain-containing protein [Alistipes sp.]